MGRISEELKQRNDLKREEVFNIISSYYKNGEQGKSIVNKELIDLGMCKTSLSLWLNYRVNFTELNLKKIDKYLNEVK
jgi:hypothetical protein